MDDHDQRGVTLIEVLLALGLLVLLITQAVPAFGQWLERQRLHGVARTLAAELQQARQEAIVQGDSRPVYLHFRPGPGWCYGFSRQSDCDCRQPDATHPEACLFTTRNVQRLTRRDAGPWPGITLNQAAFSQGASLRFDPLRGLASAGRLELENRYGEQLQIRVSPLGRIRLCSPGARGAWGVEPC